MTVSRLRVAKSETREMGERWRSASSSDEFNEWHMSDSTFLKAFIVIAAVLTILAIALH